MSGRGSLSLFDETALGKGMVCSNETNSLMIFFSLMKYEQNAWFHSLKFDIVTDASIMPEQFYYCFSFNMFCVL